MSLILGYHVSILVRTRMEVDFVLCCLFMLGLTVCVGLHPLSVNCTGCVCKSPSGVKLLLTDIFDDPIRKTCNKASYCFPSCLQTNKSCSNDTSGLVCVSEDSKRYSCRNTSTVYMYNDGADYTRQLTPINDDIDQCRIIISCSSTPIQPLDGDVVFNASHCGKLKSFVNSANTSIVVTSGTSSVSSATHVTPMLNTTVTPSSTTPAILNITSIVLSSSVSPSSSTMIPSSSTVIPSSFTVTPSSSSVVPPPHPRTTDSSDSSKLLYIVIPTAAPIAFIISFITVFCLLNWCHQRNKKKLYIKLTSTIYSEEDSDNSDDDFQ